MIRSTGEVCKYKHGENRLDNMESVKRSLEALRDYLNLNITDVNKCRWLTLAYAENMTDTERLIDDFRAFNRRCRKRYGHYEYITAIEPQGRGAWHFHCVFIFDKKAPFMDNSEVNAMWRQGFVNIRKLGNADNVGMYLTAYLADMPVEEAIKAGRLKDIKPENIKEVEVEGEKKSLVKGARMKLYPKGFNIYRISKGIRKPIVAIMPNWEAEDMVKNYKKVFEQSIRIFDKETCFDTFTNKRVFNKYPKLKNEKEVFQT
jgi:hypothetical protein